MSKKLRKILAGLIMVTIVTMVSLVGCNNSTDNKNLKTDQVTSSKVIKWKVQGYTPAGTLYDEWGKHLAGLIQELSNGRLVIEWFPAGAVVPSFEVTDAVGNGVLDAEFGYSALWTGKNAAAPLFCSVPGLFADPFDYYMWLEKGGGKQLWNEMLANHNVVVEPAGLFDMEIFLWSKEPIRTINDLKKRKIRMMPLMGDALQDNGISVAFLPGGEIIPSLDRKVIDAGEYSIPAFDITLGFQDVADYLHYPGVHQPSAVQELVINKKRWNELPDDLKKIVQKACQLNMMYTMSEAGVKNIEALKKFDELGKKKVLLEEETVNTLMKWVDNYFEKLSQKDPFFAKVRKSQMDFAKTWYKYKKDTKLPYPDWALK